MKTFKPLYQIGTVAKKTDVSIHTLRYYEKIGLIQSPLRSEGRFRVYSDKIVNKVLFIKKAQRYGLTLEEIKKITVCGDRGLEPCCDLVTKLFTGKISEFEIKIKELQTMKRKLRLLLSHWAKKR